MQRERINDRVDVLRLSPEEIRSAVIDYVRKQQPYSEVTQVIVSDWYLAERVSVDVIVKANDG